MTAPESPAREPVMPLTQEQRSRLQVELDVAEAFTHHHAKALAAALAINAAYTTLRAQHEALQAKCERLLTEQELLAWNLAGCSTYALGYGLDEPHSDEMARPALTEVKALALAHRALQAQMAALMPALRFALAVVEDADDGEWTGYDGLDVQEMLQAAGLIEIRERVVPCGDDCQCYEVQDDSGMAECCVRMPAVSALRAAVERKGSEA